MKKRIKRFFVVMAVLLAIPILAIGVMTIWNSIETKKDLEVIAAAKYGELQEIRTRSEAGYPLLNEKDKATAEEFIRAYYKNIVEKWMNFFVLKKRVRCTQITKRVK